jgi:hypothetical protein
VTIVDPLAVGGRVLDAHGRPLSGAIVTGQGTAGDVVTAATDVSGTYALYLPPFDTYTVTALAGGHADLPPAYGLGGGRGPVPYTFVLFPTSFQVVLENGDFEAGLSGWVTGSLSNGAPVPTSTAHTGFGAVQFSTREPGTTSWLSQSVALPAAPLSPTLSLLYRVPAAGEGALLTAGLVSGTTALTYTLPLTVTGWAHYNAPLPAGWEGRFDMALTLTQGGEAMPTTVLLDEVWLGYERRAVYLPWIGWN